MRTLDETIENQAWLDQVADPIQPSITKLLDNNRFLRNLLHGTWLGHPVHVAVSDVPVGAWTVSLVLDSFEMLGLSKSFRRGADGATAIGLASAMVAAASGLADWSHTAGGARRLGMVHGIGNVLATGLYTASMIARLTGNRPTARSLAGMGYGLVLFTSWAGGELSHKCGIGVNHAAFEKSTDEWESVLADSELREGDLRKVDLDGVPVFLTRYQGTVYAMGNTCTHLGGPLAEGHMEGDCVVCPWHDSYFRVTDGSAVVGPATSSARTFDVQIVGGRIEMRPANVTCQ
ncbi:MAG TPA: Rieske 2Fe-2S domain-containing protein [Chloroflexota bacterium]|nr:Rieske 2Fe-2S domain-containing protein [Chloroflexota bacterium]